MVVPVYRGVEPPRRDTVIDSLETGMSYGYCEPSPKIYSQYRSRVGHCLGPQRRIPNRSKR